jgi:hypothetical protein
MKDTPSFPTYLSGCGGWAGVQRNWTLVACACTSKSQYWKLGSSNLGLKRKQAGQTKAGEQKNGNCTNIKPERRKHPDPSWTDEIP